MCTGTIDVLKSSCFPRVHFQITQSLTLKRSLLVSSKGPCSKFLIASYISSAHILSQRFMSTHQDVMFYHLIILRIELRVVKPFLQEAHPFFQGSLLFLRYEFSLGDTLGSTSHSNERGNEMGSGLAFGSHLLD